MMSLRKAKRWSGLAGGVLAVVVALFLAGCGGSAGAAGSANSSATGGKPVLTIGLSSAPASLDPAKDGSGLQNIMRSLTNQALFHMNTTGSADPALVSSWQYVGAGNTHFEFTLKPGIRFSDGTPLTAQAVKAWLEYFAKADGPFAAALPIGSIDTSGEYTVRLNLTSPDPIVPLELSEYQNWGLVSSLRDPGLLASGTAGVGPYVLDQSQTAAGSVYTLVPDKYYFDPSAIHFSKVVVKIISSPTSMLQALQAGQLDFASLDPSVAGSLSSSGFTVEHWTEGTADVVIIDRGGALVKALGDVRVRQALNYALNRSAITRALAGEYGTPVSQMQTDYSDPNMNDYYPYDPAKARSLLAAAGYPDGFTMNVIDPGAQGGNEGDPVVQAAAQYWSAIGVKTNVTPAASNAEYIEDALSKQYAVGEWTPDRLPTFLAYAEILSPEGSLNPFHDDDPAIDQAFEQAVVTQGSAAVSQWQKINDLMTQQAINVPVFAFQSVWAVSTHLGGVQQGSWMPFASDWTWKA
jgi:peptide/nickel transport system substrate-binding protein